MNILTSLFPGLFKLGDKLIVDQDKKAEYAFRIQEMANDFAKTMLAVKSYPWVDALVKLAYASEAIIKGLFRPIVATCMFAFAVYAETHAIELSATAETLLYGAFPAWGASRHVDKQRKKPKKPIEEDEEW